MSFSNKDRKFQHDGGKAFPAAGGAPGTAASFAEVVAAALKAEFGLSPAKIKHLARLTGANERSVRNWLYARNGPSGEALVVLMRHSDAVLRAVLALAGRDDLVTASEVATAKAQLRDAMSRLGGLLGDGDG